MVHAKHFEWFILSKRKMLSLIYAMFVWLTKGTCQQRGIRTQHFFSMFVTKIFQVNRRLSSVSSNWITQCAAAVIWMAEGYSILNNGDVNWLTNESHASNASTAITLISWVWWNSTTKASVGHFFKTARHIWSALTRWLIIILSDKRGFTMKYKLKGTVINVNSSHQYITV